ncbi:MAG: MFS transporter [Candidatus Hydrogenedentes bacterium]|nr:MFS transporter [Candidatus Hydrogenedentota bacterium]
MISPFVRLCMVGFLFDFAIMAAITVMPFYVYNQLGGGAAMSGAFGGIQAAAYALTCLVSSRFVQRSRHGLRWAYSGMLLFMLLVPSLAWNRSPMLCGLQSAMGFGSLALVWPALYSWLGADPDAARRQRRLGWFNICWSAGFAFSPLVAGPLYDLDFRLAFAAVLAISLVAFAILWTLPREQDYFGTSARDAGDTENDATTDRHRNLSEAYLVAAWMAICLANVLVGGLRNVYPKHFEDLFSKGALRVIADIPPPAFLSGGAATQLSVLFSLLSFATSACFLFFGATRFWKHRLWVLLTLELVAAAGLSLLARTRDLLSMAIIFMACGAFVGGAFFSSVYYGIADPRHKHRRSAINEGVVGLGGLIGSFGFGVLAEWLGMVGALDAALPMALCCVVVQVWITRRALRRVRHLEASRNPAPVK